MISEVQEKQFQELAKQILEYINEWHHPHTTILATPTHVEILEGVMCMYSEEYLRD